MRNKLITALGAVWSRGSTSNEVFVPMTGAMDTTRIINVRYGINRVLGSAARLFVRFGTPIGRHRKRSLGLGKNSSTTLRQHGQAQLQLEFEPVNGGTIVSPPVAVFSNGGATAADGLFFPATEPMASADVNYLRGTVDLSGATGGSVPIVKPGWQVSNDLKTWTSGGTSAADGTFTDFGSTRSGNGTTTITRGWKVGPGPRHRSVSTAAATGATTSRVERSRLGCPTPSSPRPEVWWARTPSLRVDPRGTTRFSAPWSSSRATTSASSRTCG